MSLDRIHLKMTNKAKDNLQVIGESLHARISYKTEYWMRLTTFIWKNKQTAIENEDFSTSGKTTRQHQNKKIASFIQLNRV